MNLNAKIPFRTNKRGDRVVEEIKGWIVSQALGEGDRLPKEHELQELFSVSKGTAREALKSLEVQGLVTVRPGPEGGATITRVPFGRTFQLIQNYLFFRHIDVGAIYALRKLLEPELAASAVPHLGPKEIERLEASIETCAPDAQSPEHALAQRQEDLHFHNVIAEASPNELLRFFCKLLNEMLRRMVVVGGQALDPGNVELGRTNVLAHQAILAAIKTGDVDRVRTLMLDHINEAETHVQGLHSAYRRRLVLDADVTETISAPAKATRRQS